MCDSGAGFRSRLLRGIHPKTGVRLEGQAPVNAFLRSLADPSVPCDDLELDSSCARRSKFLGETPALCRCVLCLQTD